MLKDYMGILMLNENEVDIRSLTNHRPLAAISIGGRYRIIDFIMSNMVNAGVQNIGIFTQTNSRALVDHLGTGKPWDLDRNVDGLFLFNSYFDNLFNYDFKMFKNNMDYFYKGKQKNVIISPSYMICNIDFKEVIKSHEASEKNITIVYKKIKDANSNMLNCDVLNIDSNNRVVSVGKNIGGEKEANICMETFVMKKEILINFIYKYIQTGYYDSLKDSIYKNILDCDVNTYEFKGYVKCINSINQYFNANMDMLDTKLIEELFFQNGRIYTKVKHEPPTKYSDSSKVSNSLISNGCVIEGTVENSVISRNVKIHKDAVVKNSIIFQACEICKGSDLTNVIIDKDVIIEKNTSLKGNSEFPLVIEKKSIINTYEAI